MTLEFLDQATGYKMMSFTTRVNFNGGTDVGEMSFVWTIQSLH